MVRGIPIYIADILGLMMLITAAFVLPPVSGSENKYCDKAEIGICFFPFLLTKTGSKDKKAYLTYMYI